MFRHREDRLPVAAILSLTVVDFSLYFLVDSAWILWGYAALMAAPKGSVAAWSHHHQHCPTFRSTPLNRLLELVHALHTGFTTHLWTLHHVLGHHAHYLDPVQDTSRWRRLDGTPMGAWEYIGSVATTAHVRALRVGRRHPRLRRTFIFYGLLTFALVAGLCVLRPMQGLALFAFPMVFGLFFTAWGTLDHHRGLDTQDELAASRNTLGAGYNRWTGNLGYHTAHHVRGGLHWSQLPALHASLEASMPADLRYRSFFHRSDEDSAEDTATSQAESQLPPAA